MKRFLRFLFILAGVLAVAIVVLRLLFPLPDITDRAQSAALAPKPDSRLAVFASNSQAGQPDDLTGIHPLGKGDDALASRLALIELAEVSIDTQYYIWHDDVSGILLLDALDRAAKRGVRVRLLLDDNGVPGMDQFLATLNAQPNFEVRLFNPSTIRRPKLLGYVIDFFRMNRRMHNKSLIADSTAAIIGGRNIGDEYFQVGEDQFYLDLDAIAIGRVVADTVDIFDQYWNSLSVFEVGQVIRGTGDRPAFDARIAEIKATPEAREVAEESELSFQWFASDEMRLEWAEVQVVADDPAKGLGIASRDQLMITRLMDIVGGIDERLDLVSAYFVPGAEGNAFFTKLAQDGKQVRILTNALNTTDVFLVHAGYSRYRRELLEGGVELYELKLRRSENASNLTSLPLGLSGASLHAKTFAIDGKRVFIGSFNFDPRSALLNCEMGFLISSPTMAEKMTSRFDDQFKTISYQPRLTPENKMIWLEEGPDGAPIVYQQEPGAGWFLQIAFAIVGLLPVEWLL